MRALSHTPPLTGQALVDALEDEFADYRDDCNKGYCKSDAVVYAKFLREIRKAQPCQPTALSLKEE
jgi:hypothetical protein